MDFVNYSVEQGLIQSQAQDIIQDQYGFIWIATFGGLSRFDGKRFINYTRRDGLGSHIVFSLQQGGNSDLFIGTQIGLQAFDGMQFNKIDYEEKVSSELVYCTVLDASNQLYAINMDGMLLMFREGKLKAVEAFDGIRFYRLIKDNNGIAYGISTAGIYKLADGPRVYITGNQIGEDLEVINGYFDHQNRLWLITTDGIYRREASGIGKILPASALQTQPTTMVEDGQHNIWIGCMKGAYRLDKEGMLSYVGAKAGLTDGSINDVLLDRENNLWFATDAHGIFKLTINSLESFNDDNGLNGNVIMCMAKGANDELWLGSIDGGLSKYSGGQFEKISLNPKIIASQKINTLHFDSLGRLWIGTLGSGLWVMRGGELKHIRSDETGTMNDIISIYEDSSHTIWASSPSGVFYYEAGTMHKIKGIQNLIFSLCELKADTILAGSSEGLYKIINKSEVSRVNLGAYDAGMVICFTKSDNRIIMGTEDNGILIWDMDNNDFSQCSSKDGLRSDFIFSVYNLGPDTIFAGTGKGISKIELEPDKMGFKVTNFTYSSNPYGPECNLNAVYNRENKELWFGTTKGIYIYKIRQEQGIQASPLIYLNKVDIYPDSKQGENTSDTLYAWSSFPRDLNVSYKQNNITFDFTGLYFTNPEGLKFKYQLVGVDEGYSEPTSITKIVYPSLSPGDYKFRAVALTPQNIESANAIDFPFSIQSPYYQKTWFRIVLVGFLILLGICTEYLRVRLKQRRLQLNAAIRLDEQKKILERTSEDLHDDLGNKITRITILTEVLQRKVDPADTDKNHLINQIRENAEALYFSTKDIIWALTPGKDNLFDTLEKCRMAGVQLFEDTEIEFETEGIHHGMKSVQVPLSISRNLSMILKEAFTNILKHAQANEVVMKVLYTEDRILDIVISDNGIGGRNPAHPPGNGLLNMRKRMDRIGGKISISDQMKRGFVVTLQIKIPPKEG